ncbi:MAG TPA: metallopeptidase TldD-related protein [Acidimicrobiales bacterium]|nr:metallopeptidase TldD-related protein [Acidimicrobiales bacterium]
MSLGSNTLEPPSVVVEAALAASRTLGCVVIVEETSEAEVRFANNTTTTNGVRYSRRVTVISFAEVEGGVAAGVAARAGLIDVKELVRAAESLAQSTTASKDASDLLTGSAARDFELAPVLTDLSVLGSVLDDLSGVFTRAQKAETMLSGFAVHSVLSTYLGTSGGIRRRHVKPTGSFQLVGRRDGGARSAWTGVASLDFSDVKVASIEEHLFQRLEWAKKSIQLDAGRYETLLPPSAVADLMSYLYNASVGKEAEDGKSVFSGPNGGTRVGERLCELPFELRSDPAEVPMECENFLVAGSSDARVSVFDNGMALERTKWITDGTLNQLQYHRAGARQSGVSFAGPIDNLTLELPGAAKTLPDLVATTERGLLLTCLWYIRTVDPMTLLLTGLTRDGVYLIEDGQIKGAVNNFRFNESPVDLLARVSEAGQTERTRGRESGDGRNRTAMPALRIPDFNMSSVSPAS